MAIITNRQLSIFAEAFNLIMSGRSLENAFDIAFKESGKGLDRKRTFRTFVNTLKELHYVEEMFPCRNIYETFKIALEMAKENFPLTPMHFPLWIRERLLAAIGEEGITKLDKKTQWIRVNTLKGDFTETINSLKQKGISLLEKEFPMYEAKGKYPISKTKEFEEGLVIPHDLSSYFVVKALEPKRGERILEIGSAPGIKTSLIQQLTKNQSWVVSIDVSVRRTLTQKSLLRKWGVENVEIIVGDGENVPIRNIDKILIDAPCSNSGTFSSDPTVFLRLNRAELKNLVKIQSKILKKAIEYNVPTVFSTCSILPEEGEFQVERYLNRLSKIPWDESFYGYKKSKVYMHVARTYTHIHRCDSFFISRLNF